MISLYVRNYTSDIRLRRKHLTNILNVCGGDGLGGIIADNDCGLRVFTKIYYNYNNVYIF